MLMLSVIFISTSLFFLFISMDATTGTSCTENAGRKFELKLPCWAPDIVAGLLVCELANPEIWENDLGWIEYCPFNGADGYRGCGCSEAVKCFLGILLKLTVSTPLKRPSISS
jgi:hypothetical protein